MKRYDAKGGIPTLDMALSEFMNSCDLKKLAALTNLPFCWSTRLRWALSTSRSPL